jgi:hypothetical protein
LKEENEEHAEEEEEKEEGRVFATKDEERRNSLVCMLAYVRLNPPTPSFLILHQDTATV